MRITSMIVLVVLVSTGLLFLISYQRARESMSAQLEDNYSVVAEKYAQELTAWVNTNATIIDSLAAEITASGVYREGYETFHRYLAENYRLLNRDGVIYDIYFTYPDNAMTCASDYVPDGSVDYAHERDWFTVAAGTGELFYSTPYRDSDSGKPIVTISKGVYRNNTLQGVLAADIFVDVLVEIISGADVAPDSYAFLVDQNQGMIVHPYEAYAFDDVPLGVLDVPGVPYGEVISKIRSGSNETVYIEDYDGITRGVVVSRMANTGWYVGIATSKAELMQGVGSLMHGFLVAAAVSILIGGMIAVFLAHALDKTNQRQQEYEAQVRKLEKQVARETRAWDRLLPGFSIEVDAPAAGKGPERPLSRRFKLLVPMLVIFLLMVFMVLYTSRVIQNVAVTNIHEVGEDRISVAAAELENFLETAKSSLWVTADTVDHMVRTGASTDDVLDYITEETQNQKQHFAMNITGLYGYVQGEYLDSLAWVPPENYDPTRRDWYRAAIEAQGETVIISPYVDAQTNDIIISISRMLSNGTDVLSVDVMMDQIQEIAYGLQIKGKGYGYIIDKDGMLIAHSDEEKKGSYLTEDEKQLELIDRILDVKNGIFEIAIDKQVSTVFVRQIAGEWYAVIILSNKELFAEVEKQLIINVLICAVIFALIALFYLVGNRIEKNYSRRIEEMKVEEQKQAYETRMLKLAKEAADQANKAKSDFLAEMSHEIRTPINAVLGMNEMILRESREGIAASAPGTPVKARFGDINRYAANIESAGNNLLSIINDILDFSKIEAGKLEIVENGYRLSSVLNDVSNMIFFKAREKGLDFSVSVDEDIPDGLYGDEVRVRQVITNLLSNAVKYTDAGSVRLTVRGEKAGSRDAVVLTISVADTGIGIREEDVEVLFRKFQRVDMERNSTVEGAGLGLAITRSLLDKMGGKIGVQSVYGEGSTFTVTLPQKVTSWEPVGDFQMKFEKNTRDAQPYEARFHAPDARVLVVDDTRMNLAVAEGLLKKTAMRIDTAMSGPQAVELARTTAYDLILMDQRMPGMDGTEALKRIRAQSDGPNADTPVVCLTADAVIGAKERYIAEGFTDYLTKPIDSQALEKLLMRYIPKEKVVAVRDGAHTALSVEIAGDQYAPLRPAGVNPEEGLVYCQNDGELYRALLGEYARSASEKAGKLEQYYAKEDWKNYGILVHALKSTSRTIGAPALADLAARAEAAADAGDGDAIRQVHGDMIAQYDSIVAAVSRLGLPAMDPGADDDEILEFLPEE